MEIFDAHAQMGPALANYIDEFPPLYRVETGPQLLDLLDKSGISRAVVFAPHWEGGEFVDPDYEVGNRAIKDSIDAAPGRLVGFFRVNPNFGRRAQDAFDRALRQDGFRGLYLDPEWDGFNVNNKHIVGPLMEIAQSAEAPVMVDTGWAPAEPGLILRLAEAWPKVTVIMGHMGQRLIADALIVATHCPNVVLETSQCVDSFIRQAIKRIGSSRLIWGSGIPFHIPESEIMKIRRYRDITDADKEAIFSRNLAALLKVRALAP